MADTAAVEGPRLERGEALKPVIAMIRQLLRKQAAQPGVIKFAIKQYTVEVTAWERSQLEPVLGGETLSPNSYLYRMLEGVAVQAKALKDLQEIEAAQEWTDEQRSTARRNLAFLFALALAIQEELDRTVEEVVAGGRRALGKNLSEFTQRMAQKLQPVRDGLTEEEIRSAEETARSLFSGACETEATGPVPGQPERPAKPEPAPGETVEEKRPRPEPKKSKIQANRGLIIAGVLTFVLVFVAIFLAIYLDLFASKDISEGLRFVQGVRNYSGQVPNLTVTLDPDQWKSYDRGQRTMRLLEIKAAAEKGDYTQAEIRTPDGKVVARWTKENGLVRFDQ